MWLDCGGGGVDGPLDLHVHCTALGLLPGPTLHKHSAMLNLSTKQLAVHQVLAGAHEVGHVTFVSTSSPHVLQV